MIVTPMMLIVILTIPAHVLGLSFPGFVLGSVEIVLVRTAGVASLGVQDALLLVLVLAFLPCCLGVYHLIDLDGLHPHDAVKVCTGLKGLHVTVVPGYGYQGGRVTCASLRSNHGERIVLVSGFHFPSDGANALDVRAFVKPIFAVLGSFAPAGLLLDVVFLGDLGAPPPPRLYSPPDSLIDRVLHESALPSCANLVPSLDLASLLSIPLLCPDREVFEWNIQLLVRSFRVGRFILTGLGLGLGLR